MLVFLLEYKEMFFDHVHIHHHVLFCSKYHILLLICYSIFRRILSFLEFGPLTVSFDLEWELLF